jgi:hypothetical protein
MSNMKAAFCLVITVLLSLSFVQAQEAKPLARHPGDVIQFQVKFSGPNADKIKGVQGGLDLNGSIPKDQAGFRNGFGVDKLSNPSPNTFVIGLTVPSDIATGDYTLSLTASAVEGSAAYVNGTDYNVPLIHIENPKKFTPPSITVTPIP